MVTIIENSLIMLISSELFLHVLVKATIVLCQVRTTSCTAANAFGKELGKVNKGTSGALLVALYYIYNPKQNL